MDEKRILESLGGSDGVLGFIGSFGYSLWQKAEKNAKNIKGLKGWIVGLVLVSGYALYELAERKRSENYLNSKIEKLEAEAEKAEDTRNDILDRLNVLEEDSAKANDGGACDA